MLSYRKKSRLGKVFRAYTKYLPLITIISLIPTYICWYYEIPTLWASYLISMCHSNFLGFSLYGFVLLLYAGLLLKFGVWHRVQIVGLILCMVSTKILELGNKVGLYDENVEYEIIFIMWMIVIGLLLLISLICVMIDYNQHGKVDRNNNLGLKSLCVSECGSEEESGKSRLAKKFLILLKYFPIVLIVVMLMNNLQYLNGYCPYYFGFVELVASYSYGLFIFTLIASYLFGFCKWYRILLYGEVVNITLGLVNILWDMEYNALIIPVTMMVVIFITIIMSILYRFVVKS